MVIDAKLDVRVINPHAMRHTFASILAQRDVSLFKIAAWMGPSTAQVTEMYALVATDFFTAEVQTETGPEAYDVCFGVHLATRKVEVLGVTQHSNEEATADGGWLKQVGCRYLIHDGDTTFCDAWKEVLRRSDKLLLSDCHTRPLVDLERHGLLSEVGEDQVFGSYEAALAHASMLGSSG